MNSLVDFILKQLAQFWHKPIPAALICLTGSIFTYVALLLSGKSESSLVVIIISLTVGILLWITWKVQNRLPKVPPRKVGIAVAITSDDSEESKRIHCDFVAEFKKLVENDRACGSFHVIVLQGYWADEAVSNDKRAQYVAEKAGAHILFFGTSRRRPHEGKPTHFLSLRTIVRHVAIPQSTSDNIARDMSESLPQKLRFPVDGDTIVLEATSKWVSLGAKFLVGVASGLAGNFPYAEMLFVDVERQLKGAGHTAAFLQPLARQVPKHLRDLYSGWLMLLADEYYMKRDKALLEKADGLCDKVLERAPDAHPVYLHKAICVFVLTRNVKAAIELVKRADIGNDTTPHYSLAFLYAYEGNLDHAHSEYREAFKRPPSNPTVPIQSEEFIHLIMNEEPDKKHLLFCTALINYNAKEDYRAAERDFSMFLALPESENFPAARTRAEHLRARSAEKIIAIPAPEDP